MRIFLPLLLLGSLLWSCGSSNDPSDPGSKPVATSEVGKLLIVSPNDVYNSDAGDLVQDVFGGPIYGLPQAEPEFDIQQVDPTKFVSALHLHPAILVFDQDLQRNPGFRLTEDVYARNQMVCYLYFHTVEDLQETLANDSEAIVAAMHDREWKHVAGQFKQVPEKQVIEEVETQYDIKLPLPSDFEIATSRSNFAWLTLEKVRPAASNMHQISQGIMLWYTPYTDTSQFSIEALMAARDSITKQYIPGPNEGSYMAISHRAYEPVIKELNHNGQYAVEMRGLWRVENYFMGGPFVSITTLDTKNSRLITLDGYVFAPEFNKRDYLREVEAIIKGATFKNR